MSAAIASTSTTTSRMPVNPIPPIQPIMSVIILSSYVWQPTRPRHFLDPSSSIRWGRECEAKLFLDRRITHTDSFVAPLIGHIEQDWCCTGPLQPNVCAYFAAEDLGLAEERVVLDLAGWQ